MCYLENESIKRKNNFVLSLASSSVFTCETFVENFNAQTGLLQIKSNAKHNSQITVQAEAEGRTAIYTITVRVPSINISATKFVLTQGEQIQIEGIDNTLFTSLAYVVSGHATISNTGLVTVDNPVSVRNAQFTVTVTADDLPSKTLTFTVYIPTTITCITANEMTSSAQAKLGQTITFAAQMNSNATNQDVTYTVVSGANYIASGAVNGLLSGDSITLVSSTADNNPSVTVSATINDNGTNKTSDITVQLIVPVTSVTLTATATEINPKKSYTVTATVLPANATYKSLTFSLSGSITKTAETGTSVTFTVNSDAANGSTSITAASANYSINGTQYSGAASSAKTLTVK
jgi:hypothetical protein